MYIPSRYFKYIHNKKKKPSTIPKPGSGSEKNQSMIQIMKYLHEKCMWPLEEQHEEQPNTILSFF